MRLTNDNYENDALHLKNKTQWEYNNELWQYVKAREDIEKEFEIDSIEDLRDRLTTYKFLANHEMSCVDVDAYNLMLKDLDEYHSIEKELGIDLVTLFKALKGLIYKPTYEEMIKYCGGRYPRYEEGFHLKYNEPTNRYFLEVGSPIDDAWQVLELKDYGKNWALTKKELL